MVLENWIRKVLMLSMVLLLVPGISAEPVKAIGLDDVTDTYNWFMETVGLSDEDRYTNTTSYTYNELDSWGFSVNPQSDNVIYRVKYEGIQDGQWFVGKYYFGQNGEKWIQFNVSYEKHILDFDDLSTFSEEFYMNVTTYEGESNTYHFSKKLGVTNTFTGRTFQVRYAVPKSTDENNESITGLACYMDSGGDYAGLPGYQVNSTILERSPVVKFKGWSNKEVGSITYETVTWAYFQESKSETKEIANLEWWGLMEWVGIFQDILNAFTGIFLQIFWLIKLIFVDNLYLTLMLFEGFVLADALKSKSIIGWWKRVISNHVKLFNFIIAGIGFVFDIAWKVIMAISNAIRTLKPFG